MKNEENLGFELCKAEEIIQDTRIDFLVTLGSKA